MKIELHQIKVKDIFAGYEDNGEDGVLGYGGKLNIRPAYQREFIYSDDESKAVMNTVLHDFPLNVMYWVVNGDNSFEVLDGQQRTLAVMRFLDHKYPIEIDGKTMYQDALPDDLYDRLENYEFMIYFCEGTESEKLDWFKTVNIAGETLTDQELRNSVYTGSWLSDAKRHFSKRGCAAKKLADPYVKGDPNRQELLEKALIWISKEQGKTIDEYMAKHKSDTDADELWQYWQDVINWVEKMFPTRYKNMKGQPWGDFYRLYKDTDGLNSTKMDKEIANLMSDDEVQKKSGVWHYVLAKAANEPGAYKYLNLRSFEERDKRKKYKEQGGICPMCKQEGIDKVWAYNEMEGDHITPWSEGGVTEYANLQMLCKKHNRQKSSN